MATRPPSAALAASAPDQEPLYQALFDGANDAILLYDEQATLVDCNRTALGLLGTTRPVLLSSGLVGFMASRENGPENAWSSAEELRQAILTTAQTGQPFSKSWQGHRADHSELTTWTTLHRVELPTGPRVQLTLRSLSTGEGQPPTPNPALVREHSRLQLRDLLSRAGLSYVLLAPDGRVLDVNDYFLEYTEYTRAEVLGGLYHDFFALPEERSMRLETFEASMRSGRLQDYYERAIPTKSGQQRMVFWHAEFVYDAAEQITGVFLVGRDMTDRQITARALSDNRNRLQDFLDNAHDLIQNLSVDNRFLFVNKAWKEKLGYEDEDLPSLTLADVVHPYYKAKLMYQLRNLYKGEKVNKLETVFLTKTGKPVHLIGSISCSWQDDEPVATRAILHDITERIKAERLQKVYYSIANLAISAKDLHSLYGAIHRELSKIIETNNFYIALCDDDRTQLQFAYFVDQFTQGEKALMSRPFSSGISEYIIRTGRPQYLLREDLQNLISNGTITAFGSMPEVMLCSPLSVGERIIGIIAVQDYQKADAYASSDIEILHFISNQVALAIERKRNEVQINKQNARLNAIFESGNHLMWSVDMQARLTSFNRNYAAYFLRRNGVYPTLNVNLMQADVTMMDSAPRSAFVENYRKAFQGQPRRFEVQLRDARGQESWREIYLNPIYLDDGTFEEISGIAHDITDKKNSQLELVAQEEKFRAIFESFQDVYYRTDGQGILTLVSPSVYDMLGYTPEEVIGTPIMDYYMDANDRAALLKAIAELNEVRNYEIDMRHKTGYPVSVLINARRVKDGVAGTEGIGRDISELKQMQDDLRRAKDEAETSLHAKTQFLANMSHELRTPMNGIIGMIDLLHQTVSSPEQEDYVDTLRKSSDALLAILNDILDLSKIQAGKLVLHLTGIDLYYTLDKIHSLFANRAQQKDLLFTYHVSEDTPRFIRTDETRLLQMLSNLTSNAIKFTPEGGVHIAVTTRAQTGDDYTLRFEVQDSGIGITEENAKLLFTNFTQLDNGATKAFGGTGLGLAISKQLAEMLGGQIGVESRLGKGSTFWFEISCQVALNEEEIVQQRLSSRDRSQLEIERFATAPQVLLVDDNPINQKVAERLLEKLGCRIDVAGDGFEAIARATGDTRYDLIFMDIQMPEMDGVTAMREIRRQLGDQCPPVVAMTAYSMKEDAERFVQEGMDDYVSKPVKTQDLYSVLVRWRAPGEKPPVPVAVAGPEPTGAVAAAAALDVEVLQQLQELGGAEFAAQLYADFEQEAGQLLEESAALLQEDQFSKILPHVHQLKGTGFTLGLNQLGEMAKKLEHDIRQGHLSQVKSDFVLLQEFFRHFAETYVTLTGVA
ncbi:PAS domain S-box protein [Hymenobacter sp. BT18]|uniref:PAS domain S-box protein n=1 Tax=Hymenobacter sp. BT18 TaxID=2835648 RepID=UPI00143E499D|nr:PAS domain S-box protein [Hymenobacter sp. BT18]QIX60167.1 PAS domain S-box protein [Hymenobacter sp. BT18]